MTLPLAHPEPRRIVPRAVVDALIADADREISSLEAQVARAVQAADDAEGRLLELGMDERSSAWATVQLERFVTALRADARTESLAMVEEARVRARLIVEEAEAEARRVRIADALFPPDPPDAPIDLPPAIDDTPATSSAAPEALGAPVESPAVDRTTGDEPAVPELFRDISPEALDAASSTALESEFWPADAPRRRRFTRIRTAAAPTLAGLLVVAAVVLRVA